MIHYALVCGEGHAFDGWFASSAAYERLEAGRMLACPTCGTAEVARGLMAPALTSGAPGPAPAAPPAPERPDPAPNVALVDERAQKVRALMRAMREAALEHGTDVGRAFPDEARKIHYGESEPRSIYGQADREEAVALVEEGVAILPLPPADDSN